MPDELELLSLFEKEIAPYIHSLAKKIWIPPYEMSKQIEDELVKIPALINLYDQVIVSGETDNTSIYLIGKENLIIFTPFEAVQKNIVVLQTLPKVLTKYNENLWLVEKESRIINRLTFPKVSLVNPSVQDVFPSPRLALCVASLAGYLRKYQKADVRIIDMQIESTVDTIIKETKEIQPDIIGISISFGQFNLSVSILDMILKDIEIMKREPTIVAGNVLASFGYEGLLEKFPELIICNGEGERTMMDLVDYINKDCSLEDVSGITYIENDTIKNNPTYEVNMDDVPLPSMDTLEVILRNKGALTMELSRGCFHSACTFCPRSNKPEKWKGMSSAIALAQLENYKKILDTFGTPRRIFMGDEEFIGWLENGKEARRIMEISEGMIDGKFDLNFDTNTRVDQIYNLKNDRAWHLEHMRMLSRCKEAGLDRLLIGVESGSDSILKRFNKKIKTSDSMMAVRILTSLGIGLRITFITFDPLMNFSELKENIHFLERSDCFLKEANLSEISCSTLFDKVHDSAYVAENSLNHPFYENIAYMVVNLEVLLNSIYFKMLDEELLINNEPDYNMARYKSFYKDPTIGDIAISCQKWIDRHFALDYCLKGLYKVANDSERQQLFLFRADYKKISFLLLKSLTWIFDEEETIRLQDDLSDINDIIKELESLRRERQVQNEDREIIILSTLDLFNNKMSLLVDNIEKAVVNGEITVSKDRLMKVIHQWRGESEWRLINP